MRFLAFITLLLIWLAFLIFGGLLTFELYGLFIGLVMFIVILLITIFIMDKILLINIKAKRIIGSHPILDIVNNSCRQLGMKTPKVFYSEILPLNIYSLVSLNGYTIVIGGALAENLEEEEFRMLLKQTVKSLKFGNSALNFFTSAIVGLAEAPLLILNYFKGLAHVKVILQFFMQPLYLLENYVINQSVMDENILMDEKEGKLKIAYEFKLKNQNFISYNWYNRIVANAASIKFNNDKVSDYLTGNYLNINSAYMKKSLDLNE